MNVMTKVFWAVGGIVLLTGCYTTRYNLGGEPSGEVSEQGYPVDRQAGKAVKVYGTQSAIIGLAVDISEHCNGGNVAAITIEKGFFGNSHKVKMDCAKGGGSKGSAPSAAAPEKEMKAKSKKKKKKG